GSSVSSSKALAAYVLIALREVLDAEIMTNQTHITELRDALLSTWSFISKAAPQMTEEYEMAITAYALVRMRKGGEEAVLDRLSKSFDRKSNDGLVYWRQSTKSQEVEVAAYVLLTYALRRDTEKGLPILRWIIKQRSPYGGYFSTQIAPETRSVHVAAVGNGMALVEVSTFYNLLNEDKTPNFEVRVSTNASDTRKWTGKEDSGMVLIEIAFPSGYEPVPIHSQTQPIGDKYVSTKRREMDEGHLVLYYSKMVDSWHCYRVEVQKANTVVKPQPVPVTVFSYYDPDMSATTFYLPDVLKKGAICDFCGVECGCGFDPDAVPKERCMSGSMMIYPQAYPRPVMEVNKTPYPGRTIQNITTFEASMQRLRPNKWRRGQTIPVITRTGQLPVSVSRKETYRGGNAGTGGLMYPMPSANYMKRQSIRTVGKEVPIYSPGVSHTRTITRTGSSLPIYSPTVSRTRTISRTGSHVPIYSPTVSRRRTVSSRRSTESNMYPVISYGKQTNVGG
ncbi:CPMD8-like protein, partial [Mya arenaria]